MAQEACWELQVWRDEAMKCAGVTGNRKEALKQQSSSEDCGQFGHRRAEGRKQGWVEGVGTTWKREAESRALRALYDGLKAVDFIWEAIGSL